MKPVDPKLQWIGPDGRPTQYFHELIKDMRDSTFRNKVSTTAPTNGQVMTWDDTTGLWVPGSN